MTGCRYWRGRLNGMSGHQKKVWCSWLGTLKEELYKSLDCYYLRKKLPIRLPLHSLTHKGDRFCWTSECEDTFEDLRNRLLTSPILAQAYPDFNKYFTLQTNASRKGLGAILSQYQEDDRLHQVAYTSRSVTKTKANYARTDLEILAVVWAITHFLYYLYGHKVTMITDHAAILGVPNLSGKHTRWWSKVYGSGIKEGKSYTILVRRMLRLIVCLENQCYLLQLMRVPTLALKSILRLHIYLINLIQWVLYCIRSQLNW